MTLHGTETQQRRDRGVREEENTDTKTDLEVDDHNEDEDGGEEVHEVGQVLAVERLLERRNLVGPLDELVEQVDDGPLELVALWKW